MNTQVDIVELRRLHEAAMEEVRRLTQANGDLRKERDRAVDEAKRQHTLAKGAREQADNFAAHCETAVQKADALTDDRDALAADNARLQRNEDCVQRLIAWAAENGWNGVDNSKILDSFIIGLFDDLRAELAEAKEAIEDIERTLEIAEIPKYGSIGDRIPWNERVELLSDDRDALCADNARLRKALETRSRAAEGGGVGMDQDRLIEDVKRTAEYFRAEAAELRRRVAALEGELAEARRDGARLAEVYSRADVDPRGYIVFRPIQLPPKADWDGVTCKWDRDIFNAAIDAAREGK